MGEPITKSEGDDSNSDVAQNLGETANPPDRTRSRSSNSDGTHTKGTVTDGTVSDDTLIEEISIDGMCGVY